MQDILQTLASGDRLDERSAEAALRFVLEGVADDAQIGGLLSMLALGGPTVDELAGAARIMRAHVTRVPYTPREGESLIDTCGTGGTPKAFNVSTVAALIAASATPPADRPRTIVAKHGNRSRTGRGSAEVLAELGVRVDATPEVQARCLDEAGVCFCFAIHHHPAMKHAIGPRRSLGFPTIFNVLGPLTNPAGAARQVVGVYHPSLVPVVAETLQRLGAASAVVLHSLDGLDEASLAGPTTLSVVSPDRVEHTSINPSELGLASATLGDVQAASVADAASIARRVLAGEPSPHTDMACLNAAVALVVGGTAGSYAEGLRLAQDATSSGLALQTLENLVGASHREATEQDAKDRDAKE